jgi:hypothetical protein
MKRAFGGTLKTVVFTVLALFAGSLWPAVQRYASAADNREGPFISADDPVFVANELLSHLQLMQTNPLLAKAMEKEHRDQEIRLETNAHRTISYLEDFSVLYPTNCDYWNYSGRSATQRVWSIQTGVYGRCQLRMNVPFVTDSTETNIVSFDPPTLLLITFGDAPAGHFHRLYSELSRRAFPAFDWTNLVRARGDVSVLGYAGPTNQPLPDFEAHWRFRKW